MAAAHCRLHSHVSCAAVLLVYTYSSDPATNCQQNNLAVLIPLSILVDCASWLPPAPLDVHSWPVSSNLQKLEVENETMLSH